ncbi:hypothetical protein F2P81_002667 [Scophthalmus maximus]|uniref:Uncharacterized protein n=1 Tax=Scophthalmus maximus TaxID=52904 RepID=A0A6A4TP22_SCOMX|nr:hypothetical protein F2P81_002667 [Scophthalmus maximus]
MLNEKESEFRAVMLNRSIYIHGCGANKRNASGTLPPRCVFPCSTLPNTAVSVGTGEVGTDEAGGVRRRGGDPGEDEDEEDEEEVTGVTAHSPDSTGVEGVGTVDFQPPPPPVIMLQWDASSD